MQHSRPISLAINRPWAELYAFLSEPRNINLWTQGVIAQPLEQVAEHEWRTSHEGVPVLIAFTPPNGFGILDLELRWTDQAPRHYRIRLFPNEEGSEICCTILQRPGESDAQFASECEWLRTDLEVLKAYAEGL